MKHKRYLFAVLLSIIICLPTNAFFEQLEVGSRFLALGGSGAALSGDAFSQCWNPASISSVADKTIGGSYSELLGAGIRFSYLGGSLPLRKATIGFYKVNLEDPFFDAESTFKEVTYGLTFAYAPSYSLKIGVTGKRHYLDTVETAEGYSYDIGLHYSIGRINLGFVIKDLFYQLTYESDGRQGDKQRELVVGTSVQLSDDFLLSCDLRNLDLRFGLEKTYGNLKLRAGYSSSGFAAGLGLHTNRTTLDYAYQPGFYGDEHRLSLSFSL